MDVTDQHNLDDGLVEQRFSLDGITGLLWMPAAADGPVPLVLLGHPGGLDGMHPRLVQRAQSAAQSGFASATLELPGSGDRPRIPGFEAARADLRRAMSQGDPLDEIVDRLVLPLVERAAPEWQRLLDDVLALQGIRGPVAISGGFISIGIRLALVEPRIVAAGLYAGSFVPASIVAEARRVTVPVHMLLQWDDESGNRQEMLDLFDAIGSAEKTLQANLGGHRGVPAYAGEDAGRFLERHLR